MISTIANRTAKKLLTKDLSFFYPNELEALLEALIYIVRQPGSGNIYDALEEMGTYEIFESEFLGDIEHLPEPSRGDSLHLVRDISANLINKYI